MVIPGLPVSVTEITSSANRSWIRGLGMAGPGARSPYRQRQGTMSSAPIPALQLQLPESIARMTRSCHGPVVRRNLLYIHEVLRAGICLAVQ